jgi:6-phosphogluconolactonase
MTIYRELCNTRQEAAQLAAARIADSLERDLGNGNEAAIVVSGGSTPAECFDILAHTALPWDRVHVVPSDERWVPPDHAASNEKMIRQTLLVDRAAAATFHGLHAEGESAAGRCAELAGELDALPQPFSSALLGMGEDGHFASLFPDAAGLEQGLDVSSGVRCLAVKTIASPHERISLTLATLVRSREIILLAYGYAKREVLENAQLAQSAYPVSRLLQQQQAPVRVIWAP